MELGGGQPAGGAAAHLPGPLPAQQRQAVGAGPDARQDHRDAPGAAREPARAQLSGSVGGVGQQCGSAASAASHVVGTAGLSSIDIVHGLQAWPGPAHHKHKGLKC